MPPPDVDNQKNPSRTVLLATDNRNSVVAEIVDGKTNQIVYSAFGYLSAQQEVTTQLGFNGELREAQSCWYFLGNGYRAYNPRLMRFHSPDSWSPFGRGGLNPYMYCVGDPVNRSDPTGHSPLFPGLPIGLRKFVSRVDRFFLGGSGITGPNRIAAPNDTLAMEMAIGRPMRPESDGFFQAMDYVGTIVAGAPGPRGNHSPRFTSVEPDRRTYPGYEAGAIAAGSSSSGSSSSRSGSSRAGNLQSPIRNRSSGGDAPPPYVNPPSYSQAMQYSNPDTFAATQQGRTYIVNPNYVSHHPTPPPPPPPSSSSASSRDSTPPRSRHPSDGNNAQDLSGLGTALRFIRRQ